MFRYINNCKITNIYNIHYVSDLQSNTAWNNVAKIEQTYRRQVVN